MIRTPVVSGQFYPEKAEAIKNLLNGFIGAKSTAKTLARGIVLPHAGYVYSGKVAATTVSKVSIKKTLIILGPNHTGLGNNFALWSKGEWQTPLGAVKINEGVSTKILDAGITITADELGHKFEHSIEVELPILQHLCGNFDFVPICCQITDISSYQKAAAQICGGLKGNLQDVSFVASTDMTHYEPDTRARKKDSLAIDQIINLDPENLLRTVQRENISMCGIAPVCVFLYCMQMTGARKAQVALYQTSGDASGDYDSVVGYAGIIVQ